VGEEAAGSPAVRGKYDEVAQTYDADYTAAGESARNLVWEVYQSITWAYIEPLLPLPAAGRRRPRALDAGGGTGRWGLRLAEKGLEVTVLDLSPAMLEQAQAKARAAGQRIETVAGNIASLPFPDDAFDFIMCEGDPVSYCVDDHQQAIAELVRVAVPGAHVALGVDNRLWAVHDRWTRLGAAAAVEVLRSGRASCPYGLPVMAFTPRQLREELDRAGADLVRLVGKPMLTTLLLACDRQRVASIAADPALRRSLVEIELALAAEGYGDLGGHLHVVARKRAPAGRGGAGGTGGPGGASGADHAKGPELEVGA
jgi:SAM-dependent methyltransferase